MEQKETRSRWQRGQAMMEYWPTIPAAILLMLFANFVVQFIEDSLLQTVDALNPTGLECDEQNQEQNEGPTYAQLDCHSVQLVARSYDEANDRTTVGYKVVSGCDPSISHWSLGLPSWMRGNVLSVSEAYEWGTDPATGVSGIKFDTGYESASTDTGKPKDKKSLSRLSSFRGALASTDSRTVLITLAGHYDWGITELAVKAGTTTVVHSTITAPIQIYKGTEEQCEM